MTSEASSTLSSASLSQQNAETSSKPPDTIQNNRTSSRRHPIGVAASTPTTNGSHDLNPTDKQPIAGVRER